MQWLLDGYNVIRRDADLRAAEAEGLGAGRAALLRVVAGVAQRCDDTFVVVFDGARRGAGAPGPGRVKVLFSSPPQTADDVLRAMAAQLRSAAIVVSSDRVVRDAAVRAGATAVSAEEFLRAVDADGGQEDEDDEPRDDPRRGNPRQPSRADRASRRALGRLRRR